MSYAYGAPVRAYGAWRHIFASRYAADITVGIHFQIGRQRAIFVTCHA